MPNQRQVHLPENEEVAGKLLEKHRSMEEDSAGRSPGEREARALHHLPQCLRRHGTHPKPPRPAPYPGRWTLGHSCDERLLSRVHPRFVSKKQYTRKEGEEAYADKTLCATEKFCSLRNIDHTLQGNDKRQVFMMKLERIDAEMYGGYLPIGIWYSCGHA